MTLEEAVARHRTLADAVAWGLAHTPPLIVADIIVQDEYTYDVVLPYRDGRFLVYDTT
jgi:hypothetical protein